MKKIIIGARGSKLSLAYVSKVKSLILGCTKDVDIHIKTIKTSGDIHQDIKLCEIGGKSLFCKEIEENLIKNNIDIAVHSLKDMESAEHRDLMIGAFIKRNDPRDVLVSNKIKKLSKLNNIVIGSSSKRRELQLKKINKNISVVNLRGNIDTRIQKVEENKLDAIIAQAMMSINAVKGVEIGAGFDVVTQRGSEARDEITPRGFLSNFSGGTLGGISTGQDLEVSIALKPTSSILVPGKTVDIRNKPTTVRTKGRHDPCVGIRAVPIAEAMMALTLCDLYLRHKAQNL